MAKLGTEKRPAIARVQTQSRANEILSICDNHDWKVVIGVEPDKDEDITDINRLLDPTQNQIYKTTNIRRNEPCSCGSGLKYKKCCMKNLELQTNQINTPKYQFKPGTYGDANNYMPSIACQKQTNLDKWEYHFVLVNPIKIYDDLDEAYEIAENDLNIAFQKKENNCSDFEVAEVLKTKGYKKVNDYNIVEES